MIINVLLITLISIVVVFFLMFTIGFIVGGINSKKRFTPHAKYLYSQLTPEGQDMVEKVWLAYKKKDKDSADRIVSKFDSDQIANIEDILSFKNRPKGLSSGVDFDRVTWNLYEERAVKIGFSDRASAIVAGVGLNEIDEVFKK